MLRLSSFFTLLCAACFTLAGCGVLIATNSERTRPDSPLRSVCYSNLDDAKIRLAVLKHLPVGSSPDQIKAFLARNFRGVRYKVLTTRPRWQREWLGWPEGPQICFRPYDYEAFASDNYVEIHLMLDGNERLKDVVVHQDHTAL